MEPLRRVLQFGGWTRTPSPLLQSTTPPFQFQQVTADNTRCSKRELGYTTLAGWGRRGPPNGSTQNNTASHPCDQAARNVGGWGDSDPRWSFQFLRLRSLECLRRGDFWNNPIKHDIPIVLVLDKLKSFRISHRNIQEHHFREYIKFCLQQYLHSSPQWYKFKTSCYYPN